MNLLFVLKHVYCNLLSVTVYRSCIKSSFLKSESFRVEEHNTIIYTGWDFKNVTFAVLTRWLHLRGFVIRKCMGVSPGQEKVPSYNEVTLGRGSGVD